MEYTVAELHLMHRYFSPDEVNMEEVDLQVLELLEQRQPVSQQVWLPLVLLLLAYIARAVVAVCEYSNYLVSVGYESTQTIASDLHRLHLHTKLGTVPRNTNSMFFYPF